jgi:hypothetical protein
VLACSFAGCLVGRLIPLYALQQEQIVPGGPVGIATTSHARPYFVCFDRAVLCAELHRTHPLSCSMRQTPPLPLDWNVSHDGRLVVGAWCAPLEGLRPGTFAVGVDVMRLGLPDGFPDYDTLVGSVGDLVRLVVWLRGGTHPLTLLAWPTQLAPSEHRALAALPDDAARTRHLIRLWTYKEAVAKLLGLGAAIDFSSLAFDLEPDRPAAGTLLTLTSTTTELPAGKARDVALWEGRFGPESDTYAVVVARWRRSAGAADEVYVHQLPVEDVVAGARALVRAYT